MNIIRNYLCLLLLCTGVAIAENDLSSWVDPFIGSQVSSQHDAGNTIPGAARPFGMLYWSPDPVQGWAYRYGQNSTRGFSLTHLSGPGCGAYGDVPILPIIGAPDVSPVRRPAPYIAKFKQENEAAQPGYYAVKLDSGIQVELAAQVHSGIAEIHFPAGRDSHSLLIDLSRNLSRVTDAQLTIEGNVVSGSVAGGGFCGLDNHYRVFFVLEVDETPQSAGTFDESDVHRGAHNMSGPRSGGYFEFSPQTEKVHLRVGLSFVSVANARMNLKQEVPDWDFAKHRSEARQAWNEKLGLIVVRGGDEARRKTFYTALYHAFLHPTIFNDVNGEYPGFDGKTYSVHGRNQYANLSEWDIYRTQIQLLAMLQPKVAGDIAQSILNDAEQGGGGLPLWPMANDETGCMVSDTAANILAAVYSFGVRDFNARAALEAMLQGGDNPRSHIRLMAESPGLAEYLSHGYVDENSGINGSASTTLEHAMTDFAVAQFASALGDRDVAQRYMARSGNWKKLFDPETKLIRPRTATGEFLSGFKPDGIDGFVEGNSAQYTLMIPYNLKGLIEAMGGPEATKTRLDQYFSQYASWLGGPYFFIANEPSFGDPWIYNWTGHPWRTQEVIRKTLDDLFTPTPEGEPGNDDLGATAAWIVFAHLGIYPEIPSVAGFAVSSPAFPDVEMNLGSHTLHIHAEGAPEKLYVGKLAVDGKPISNWWIDWKTMKNASDVVFSLAPDAVRVSGEAPPSFGLESSQPAGK